MVFSPQLMNYIVDPQNPTKTNSTEPSFKGITQYSKFHQIEKDVFELKSIVKSNRNIITDLITKILQHIKPAENKN